MAPIGRVIHQDPLSWSELPTRSRPTLVTTIYVRTSNRYREIVLADSSSLGGQRSPTYCGDTIFTTKIEKFQINIVIYELVCTLFLAIRTLRQLTDDEERSYTMRAKILCRNVCIDNVLTEANSVQKALELRKQLISLCKGGFPLKKWAANESSLLKGIHFWIGCR